MRMVPSDHRARLKTQLHQSPNPVRIDQSILLYEITKVGRMRTLISRFSQRLSASRRSSPETDLLVRVISAVWVAALNLLLTQARAALAVEKADMVFDGGSILTVDQDFRTRRGLSGRVHGPQEAVSIAEAILRYTADGPYLIWDGKIKGMPSPENWPT